MNAKALVQLVNDATPEEQKLIAALLAAPQPLKHSFSEAFEQVKKKKALDEFLQSVVAVALKASYVVPMTPKQARSSDFEKLVKVFTAPEVLEVLAPDDPLAAARLKGVLVKRELLYEDGQPFKSDQVAQLLGISRQAVDKRRSKGQLLAVSLGRRGYFYPVWQFRDSQVLAGLDKVLTALKEYDPWTQLMFMKTGDIRLDGATPKERLLSGDVDAVVEAASCYGFPVAA